MKMTLGTNERGKVVVLLALVAVGGIVFWINSGGEPAPAGSTAPAGPRPVAPLVAPRRAGTPERAENPAPAIPAVSARARVLQDFRPSLKPRRPEDRPDPMSLDPQIRTDLLAKLQNVGVEGTNRNIFDFSQPPVPRAAAAIAAAKNLPPVPSPIVGEQASAPATPPPPPPPPKVPLKFYGFIAAQGPAKRAFFLEGDEIHVVAEGDVVKKRYRIVRIGVNSAVVEDMGHENNQQTLPLEEAPAG